MRTLLLTAFTLLLTKSFAYSEFEKKSEASYYAYGIFHLFDATLYLEKEYTLSDFPANIPIKLTLNYKRNISREQIIGNEDTILEDLHGEEKLKKFATIIEKLRSTYTDVKAGDQITITYRPNVGIQIMRNNKLTFQQAGLEFARIYFSLWVSGHPHTIRLRDDLLGKRDR